MKRFITGITLLALHSASCLAALPVAPGFQFNPGAAVVVWDAPTNDLPDSLWIYKTVKQQFAPSVVSNLMWLGDFTQQDVAKAHVADEIRDKDTLYFANKDRTRHLGIYPSVGYIEYSDENALANMKSPPKNIPSDEQALKLALNYLRFVGVDRSQIAKIPGTTDLRVYRMKGTRSYTDRTLNKRVTSAIDKRGVYFVRWIDGVEFTGIFSGGGVAFDFADDWKIFKLVVNWRNFQPHKLVSFPTSNQIMERINQGQATVVDPIPNGITNITVKSVSPFYQGLAEDDKQPLLYPFANVELELQTAHTNHTLRATCPIVLTE